MSAVTEARYAVKPHILQAVCVILGLNRDEEGWRSLMEYMVAVRELKVSSGGDPALNDAFISLLKQVKK